MVTDMAYKHLNKPKNDLGQQEIFWTLANAPK
jgi:hypothetical protein